MSSLKSFLTEKVTQIENNVKNTIVSELGKNMKEITELNTGVPSPVNQDLPDGQTKTWNSVVSQPRNLKSVMRNARNDEKIEENEKEKRSKNIIIHGAVEVGENPEKIKKEDFEYVKQIFAKIGVQSTPTLVTRLDKQNESRTRPIKITMKTKEEKSNVMENRWEQKGILEN